MSVQCVLFSRRNLLSLDFYLRRRFPESSGDSYQERLQVPPRSPEPSENSSVLFYRYVGEWFDKDDTEDNDDTIFGLPTDKMKDNASKTLYLTAGVYAVFVALSLVCIGMGSRRK